MGARKKGPESIETPGRAEWGAMTGEAIDIGRLVKRYPGKTAVDRVSLGVREGEIFGFLGPNGAGKTTTIRVLLGLLCPSEGRATILGRDCWRDSARIRRDVGYLPGDLRLPSWLTFRSAVRLTSLARTDALTRPAQNLAERLDLETGVRVRAMSRGMRQKLGLILALAHHPRVLILDEPTASLDPIAQETLARILRERAAAGAAVFFSSHTLSEVERLCDRVAIVRDGRIVADETIAELRTRARRVVTLLFGTADEAGRFEAPDFLKVDRREGARVWCELHAEAPRLIAWLASQQMRDVEISPPNLERLFQGFYREARPGGDAPAGADSGTGGP